MKIKEIFFKKFQKFLHEQWGFKEIVAIFLFVLFIVSVAEFSVRISMGIYIVSFIILELMRAIIPKAINKARSDY